MTDGRISVSVIVGVCIALVLIFSSVAGSQSSDPTITVGGYTDGQIVKGHPVPKELLWQVWKWFPQEHHRWAVRVAMCESGGVLHARNPNTRIHLGWWQHDQRYIEGRMQAAGIQLHVPVNPLFAYIHSPEIQANITAHLLLTGGKSHWECK